MLQPYKFYWFRIDIKYMTKPYLDQALTKSENKCGIKNTTKKLEVRTFKLLIPSECIDRQIKLISFEYKWKIVDCENNESSVKDGHVLIAKVFSPFPLTSSI